MVYIPICGCISYRKHKLFNSNKFVYYLILAKIGRNRYNSLFNLGGMKEVIIFVLVEVPICILLLFSTLNTYLIL